MLEIAIPDAFASVHHHECETWFAGHNHGLLAHSRLRRHGEHHLFCRTLCLKKPPGTWEDTLLYGVGHTILAILNIPVELCVSTSLRILEEPVCTSAKHTLALDFNLDQIDCLPVRCFLLWGFEYLGIRTIAGTANLLRFPHDIPLPPRHAFGGGGGDDVGTDSR